MLKSAKTPRLMLRTVRRERYVNFILAVVFVWIECRTESFDKVNDGL